jgi:hypothetical protein
MPTAVAERLQRRSGSRFLWAVLCILVLAAVARMVGIGSRLSIDDAYSWFVAASPTPHVFLARLADNENTPPLFYLVLMAMPGTAPAWLRLPAALPGVLMCVVLCLMLRPRLGNRTALLAGLGVAASPYLITYSNLARGFMLADLALLVAVWSLLSLGERETRANWAVFILAGTVAVWTEYGSIIFIAALILAALWIGTPRRQMTAAAGAACLISLAPWIPEIVRGQHQVGITKYDPLAAAPSLSGLRDIVVTLAFGENGGTASHAGRWLAAAVIVALAAAGCALLRRRWASLSVDAQRTLKILGASGALTLIGYAAAAIVGIDIFTQRYLTILIPLAVALGAAMVASIQSRYVTAAAALALVALALVEVERRFDGEWQPSLAPEQRLAAGIQPRTVLTNTPVVLYYLRGYPATMDRPYNLGQGLAASCQRPCLIIDDSRVHGGSPRVASGQASTIGPFNLTLER